MEKKKKWKFNWFGMYNIDGKGVSRDELEIIKQPNFINFFKLYGRKFWRLITVNLIFIFGNFPIFFFFMYKAGYFLPKSTSPVYQSFIPLYGASMFGDSPVMPALFGIFGKQVPITVQPLVPILIYFALIALLLFTFGPVNTGITYICRNMVKGEPIFMWSDFKYAIKRNFKQSLIIGILDLLALLLLSYDVVYFLDRLGPVQMYIMFYMSALMLLVFFIMRFYIYHIMITFDLSIFKILKNSLIFSILGIKRNLMGLLGFILLFAINYLILSFYQPIGILLPFIIVPASMLFIESYVAYPKIKEYMIDPYADENADENGDGTGDTDSVL